MIHEKRKENIAAVHARYRNILPELEGVRDDARGLIEVKDSLVELPPVVIRTLLRRSRVRGVAVDPDGVVAPGSRSEILITMPVWLS